MRLASRRGKRPRRHRGFALAEAARNVLAAPFLFGGLAFILALLGAVAMYADLAAISTITTAEREFLAAGGDILRVTNPDGAIDAAQCAQAAGMSGVVAASAVTAGSARLTGRPEHAQTVLLATDGIGEVLGVTTTAQPPLATDQVMAGQVLAERWDWAVGTEISFNSSAELELPTNDLEIVAMPDMSILGSAVASAVVLPAAATGNADECVVKASPAALEDVAAALPALFADWEDPEARVEVAHMIRAGEFGPDPAADFAARPTQFLPAAAGLAAGALIAIVTWTRRQRAAIYATLGMPYATGVAVRAAEATWPVAVGAVWGGLWAALLALATGLNLAVMPTVALHATAYLAAALAVVALVSLWRPPTLAALKDR